MRTCIRSVTIMTALSICTLATSMGIARVENDAPPGGVEIEAGPEPTPERDGRAYPVSELRFEYALAHPDLPPVDVYEQIEVLLVRTSEGYIGPIDGAPTVALRLGELDGSHTAIFYGSAIAAITRGVRDYLENEHGLIGQLVTPMATEINFEGDRGDLRPPGETHLTIQIWRAIIGETRTLGYGRRHGPEDETIEQGSRINHLKHRLVLERSPVREGDLLNRERIDRRVHFLNRSPSRRVDVGIGPTGQAGEVVVDYMITEPKPWLIYGQVSNTGTQSTDDWVYRLGLIHNQLSGRDDVLQFDYTTAGFGDSHALFASYERPFGSNERVRWKVYGGWNEYTASDVGFVGFDFKGEGYQAGGEVAWNVWQDGAAFLDLVGGARYQHVSVNNELAFTMGSSGFLLPYVGVRGERVTPVHSLLAELMLETNLSGVSDSNDLVTLGRTGVTDDFSVLRGQVSYSFFLEPLLNPAGFEGRKSRDEMTLAHEVWLSARGQTTFGERVVPNFQQTAGGFYTVRGYDESLAVGDDVIIATAEYRFHLGRALPEGAELDSLFGRPFRSRRSQPYGSADWDVVLRAFIDAAATHNNKKPSFERNETLVGAGVGIAGRLKNNLSARVDVGWALQDAGPMTNRTEAGDLRVHFVASFTF